MGEESGRTEQQHSHFDVGYMKFYIKYHIAMSYQIFSVIFRWVIKKLKILYINIEI